MEKIIFNGAEAVLYLDYWFNYKIIKKIRKPKDYRQKSLDLKIRKFRTINEATFLHKCKTIGVKTPTVFLVDTNNHEIIIEYIEGKTLKDLIENNSLPFSFDKIGEIIALMHKYDIIHGDLTTSNFIINENIYVIDFGLSFSSKRLEDKAVDLHLFKEILNSCHSSSFNKLLEQIYSGYKNILGQSSLNAIIDKIDVIESRRRYSKIE